MTDRDPSIEDVVDGQDWSRHVGAGSDIRQRAHRVRMRTAAAVGAGAVVAVAGAFAASSAFGSKATASAGSQGAATPGAKLALDPAADGHGSVAIKAIDCEKMLQFDAAQPGGGSDTLPAAVSAVLSTADTSASYQVEQPATATGARAEANLTLRGGAQLIEQALHYKDDAAAQAALAKAAKTASCATAPASTDSAGHQFLLYRDPRTGVSGPGRSWCLVTVSQGYLVWDWFQGGSADPTAAYLTAVEETTRAVAEGSKPATPLEDPQYVADPGSAPTAPAANTLPALGTLTAADLGDYKFQRNSTGAAGIKALNTSPACGAASVAHPLAAVGSDGWDGMIADPKMTARIAGYPAAFNEFIVGETAYRLKPGDGAAAFRDLKASASCNGGTVTPGAVGDESFTVHRADGVYTAWARSGDTVVEVDVMCGGMEGEVAVPGGQAYVDGLLRTAVQRANG